MGTVPIQFVHCSQCWHPIPGPPSPSRIAYSLREASEALGVDARVILGWIKRGWLTGRQPSDRTRWEWRIRRRALRNCLAEHWEAANAVTRAGWRRDRFSGSARVVLEPDQVFVERDRL